MKILFVGPPGAGKSTAIRSLSDFPPVSTEVPSSDEVRNTTVALDFGEIDLTGEDPVRLYGVPGQERFEFLWPLIGDGAIGMLILVDATDQEPLQRLDEYLGNFATLVARIPFVVALTRADLAPHAPRPADIVQHLRSRHGLERPVLEVDMRDKPQVLYLMQMLLTLIEQKQGA